MNEVFRKEWELYTAAGRHPQFRGLEKREWKKGFDGPVKVGEVRVFADMNRPFVALILESRGAVGYRLVPVSPFTVPASAREMLVGERVFQLWNAVTASRSFVERSWLVATLRVPPGNRLEKLSGKREGQWSIRINDQWRVCFEWTGTNAANVEICDYH